MLELNFEEILKAVNGEEIKKPKAYLGKMVSTDTRKIEEGSIFVALKGENFDANNYAKAAIDKGASLVIVESVLFDIDSIDGNVGVIKVENGEKALAHLASFYRNKLGIKVVGVTGSTGKTSTKDIMSSVLSTKYKVFKTKGNFNNHIGLPLMILELDSTYDIAILEMGMSDLKEISFLAQIAKPEIAVITNVGLSHIENLKTRDNILKAKMEIVDFFIKENTLIINADDDMLKTVEKNEYKLIRTGLNKELDPKAENIELNKLSSTFDIVDGKLRKSFNLSMPGKHNVGNFMLAYCVARELFVSIEEMQDGIENIEVTSMRLDLKDADGFKVLDDCYNSSPDSVKSAIDLLVSLNGAKKIAALGTMRELGTESERAHREIGAYAKEKGLEKIFVFGEFAQFIKEGFEEGCNLYEDKQILIEELKNYIQKDDIVLIKASRGLKFEEITKALI
ncbi:UDP-N-acetylmuramoyl-tripeptide--D-alanyl-D-alanine ligase [uncultured Clostridium sp.]|jgi:UDP-N-acetylmuramoyl-tripeptide--D-alanyl-D-alanine ligase|uniref:UDP-N-acetylmuramoyl-tripeptide--D-alanyl-D- alanine ligase n=1 Tax=uncultured Clostridium sp. TaxID=59620 RepID=UPI00263678F6|nr:UDP-N-acetylmuramoyl-tripeptide--D-alanyl-D-alanine ligase [uncultured Clostridium sp.]